MKKMYPIIFDFENYMSQKTIIDLECQKGIFLKNNKRSSVKLVEYQNKKLLIKEPLDKDRRWWIRFLTLFRKSEAMSAMESMAKLRKNDIATNKPLACIEYRQFGMVVRSLMLYEYIEAGPATNEHAKEIIDIMKKIHSLGYLHGDPQQKNFLYANGKVFTIDANLKRNFFGKIGEHIEYIKLSRVFNDGYKHINTKSLSHRIAMFYIKNYGYLKPIKLISHP